MIQSFSDIITNSSSELFIIKNPKEKGEEIVKFLTGVYKLLGRNIDDDLCMRPADQDDIAEAKDWGYKCKKGDMVIWSADENSIPYPIMVLIEGLDSLIDIPYGSVERHHLGQSYSETSLYWDEDETVGCSY